ncbi:MAG: synthase subunit epsilon [Gammaproteobacteria bacterium]|jgi:F-type H+-transporting ATPase subunit epsilon|nr:synthase subunit epsilon [Gammaproteobacteria bacterium]
MAMSFHLDIVSAEAEIFSGRAEIVMATGTEGELGICKGHTPLLTMLKPGFVRVVKQGGDEEIFYISGGALEVQPEVVTILADVASRASDLDEAAALQAKSNAEKMLTDKTASIEYAKAMTQMAEATAQLRAIRQIRKKAKV